MICDALSRLCTNVCLHSHKYVTKNPRLLQTSKRAAIRKKQLEMEDPLLIQIAEEGDLDLEYLEVFIDIENDTENSRSTDSRLIVKDESEILVPRKLRGQIKDIMFSVRKFHLFYFSSSSLSSSSSFSSFSSSFFSSFTSFSSSSYYFSFSSLFCSSSSLSCPPYLPQSVHLLLSLVLLLIIIMEGECKASPCEKGLGASEKSHHCYHCCSSIFLQQYPQMNHPLLFSHFLR